MIASINGIFVGTLEAKGLAKALNDKYLKEILP
jgi:hypothetical protein